MVAVHSHDEFHRCTFNDCELVACDGPQGVNFVDCGFLGAAEDWITRVIGNGEVTFANPRRDAASYGIRLH